MNSDHSSGNTAAALARNWSNKSPHLPRNGFRIATTGRQREERSSRWIMSCRIDDYKTGKPGSAARKSVRFPKVEHPLLPSFPFVSPSPIKCDDSHTPRCKSVNKRNCFQDLLPTLCFSKPDGKKLCSWIKYKLMHWMQQSVHNDSSQCWRAGIQSMWQRVSVKLLWR